MKKIYVLLLLTLLAHKGWSTGEPSTRFNIFIPPNNDAVRRDVCLIVTAIYDNTSFTIIDDSLDGDNDDSKSGVLMAGQSYILYIRDNGINDDAQYASGGTLKQDGDYFTITSNKLVFASQSTNSDWQHDWVPSVNKSSYGERFIIYAPKISSSNRDFNVFAYEDSTFVTIKKISKSATTVSGYTNIDSTGGVIIAQRMLNVGQDLIYAYTDARDIMVSGETYQIETSKPVTVQYGALWGNERDGGGYVPTSNGSSSGDLLYFAVPFQSGTTGEQEIRIVSWDDNNTVTLERYSGGTWIAVKTWNVNRLKAVDWVGRNNGNVNYANVFRIKCTSGKKVSVFEGDWFETGSPGTSDMATMVASEEGTTAGSRFLTYMAPPGNEQNVRNPFTGNLFAQSLTHVYLFASSKTAQVTVKDAYTNGTKFNRTYTINAGRYVDCYLTVNEWKSIYNGTGTTSGPERPYLLIESDNNISVMNSNFNDNWMMYFGTSQEQSFNINSSSSSEYTKPGDTVTISSQINVNSTSPLTNVNIEVIAQSGLQVVNSTFNNNNTSTINGNVNTTNEQTAITFNNVPDLQPNGTYTIETTVVTQVANNNGSVIPNNTVKTLETVTTGTADGVPQQSVSTNGITINTTNTSNMLFSSYLAGTFADSTDSWTCSCVDINNDGYDDIYYTERNKLKTGQVYINTKNRTFNKTTLGSINKDKGVTVNHTWADIDNDGDNDLLTIHNTYSPNMLHLNDGTGNFASLSTPNFIKNTSYYHGASWVDIDNDGFLDVYLLNYMPTRFNELYHNNGNGTFSKIEDGVLSLLNTESVGSTWADYDNDGLLDLFVPDNRLGKNKLYRNKGNNKFEEQSQSTLAADGGYSVGSCWGDYDNDGDLDLFVANASNQKNYLYVNNGGGVFSKDTSSVITKDAGHSHSCSWIDFDNDADLDLYVTNDKGFKFLYQNNGNGSFTKINNELVTADYGNAFGQTWCDFDHDGDLDLYVATHSNQPNKFFINNGNTNNWCAIKLTGTQSNASAIGARIHLKCGGKWQLREVNSQSGFGGQNSYRQHFGLGANTVIDSIKIEWPSGNVDCYTVTPINQFLSYTEKTTVKVTGIVYNDANNNCVQDQDETGIAQAEVYSGNQKAYTDQNGNYTLYVPKGTQTIHLKSNTNVTATTCTAQTINATGATISNVSIAANALCNNADINTSVGITALRRGFKNQLKINLKNIGQQASSNFTLTLTVGNSLIIKSASQTWASKTTGANTTTYVWDIVAINKGSEAVLTLEDSVSRSAILGAYIDLNLAISNLSADCDPINNNLALHEKIVGSIDPNEKYVYPSGVINKSVRLNYKIAFQNVGNYPAEFVEITDLIPDNLDMESIKLTGSSHPAQISIVGRKITWLFEHINLPDSATNNAESQGYVTFEISPAKNSTPQSVIKNKAFIVFDYNDAIQTNETWNIIAEENDDPYYLTVYPNPSQTVVKLAISTIHINSISGVAQIVNTLGLPVIDNISINDTETRVNINELPAGVYFVKVYLEGAPVNVQRLIKE